MLQATVCDSGQLEAFAFCEDRLRSAKVDVGRCDVFDALMIAGVIVVLDEGVDLPFEISGQIVVVEQNAVFWCWCQRSIFPGAVGRDGVLRTCCMPLPSSHLARSSAT